MEFSAVVTQEGKQYSALCAELDIATQGKGVEEALANLKEAIELYLEDEDAKIPKRAITPKFKDSTEKYTIEDGVKEVCSEE